jgi:ribose transport system permease protein
MTESQSANVTAHEKRQAAPNNVFDSGRLQRLFTQNSFLFALLLLAIMLLWNASLQSNLFELRTINQNLRNYLPLIILAAGQTIVVIGGGIDLSVGSIVSMVNAIMVTSLTAESTPEQVILAMVVACIAGMAAGAVNGFSVAYLRLQPIVTTYATSFVFGGLALYILPRPGGAVPGDLPRLYRSTPADIPFVLYMIVLLLIVWWTLRRTRYGQYLFGMGGKAEAAYSTGVPVNAMRFSMYVLSGLFAALSAIALTVSIGTGNPRIGEKMTLDSIVAVVLGGTRLSGGQGGVFGTLLGVLILRLIQNIISFSPLETWDETLINALIIILALAGPGLLRLLRKLVGR